MLDVTPAFAAFPVLETERCILRAVSDNDLEPLFRILSSPDVSRYLGRHPLSKREEITLRMETYRKTFEERSGVAWMITHRTQGEVIGTCALWKLDTTHHRAELGYILSPEYWGQGLVPEAAAAVCAFGFNQMGLHTIEAQIAPANNGSRRVLEKLGFVQEGYFRESFYNPVTENFEDTAVFSLIRGDWLSRTRA